MRKVKKFEAFDGTLFDNEKQCHYYENRVSLLQWINRNIEYSEDEGINEDNILNAIIADIETLVTFTDRINENQPNGKVKVKKPIQGNFYWVKVSLDSHSPFEWFIGYYIGVMWKIWGKSEIVPASVVIEIGNQINRPL